ncbi:MAG: hypothetical protein GY878_04465 [Fuerstiella sp.]|nr:hypothetical protein [Fuerstiella sp.]
MTMTKLTPEQRTEIEQAALYQIRLTHDLGGFDFPVKVHLMERTDDADIVQVASAIPPRGRGMGLIQYFAVERDELATATRVHASDHAAFLAAQVARTNTDTTHSVRKIGQFYVVVQGCEPGAHAICYTEADAHVG